MKRRVTDILRELNIPPHVRGYEYLREAIMMCAERPELIYQVTKVPYPVIAERYNTTGIMVERAIRYAIEKAFETIPEISMRKYFRLPSDKWRPTNREYIATIADLVRMEQEEKQVRGA